MTKYNRWYSSIIENAKKQNRVKDNNQYYELHHIIPKSLGGNNSEDNLVLLTLKEHYICHLLLTKTCDKKNKPKMIWALHRMAFSRKGFFCSRHYEKIRKMHIKKP